MIALHVIVVVAVALRCETVPSHATNARWTMSQRLAQSPKASGGRAVRPLAIGA
jgi:hypothetical protein